MAAFAVGECAVSSWLRAQFKVGFFDQPEQYAQLESCHPQGRIGIPEEVAALILALADGDLCFLHGACVGMHGEVSGYLYDPV